MQAYPMCRRPNAESIYCHGSSDDGLVSFSFASDEDQNVCQGDPNQWQELFNGKDLTGWKHVGPGVTPSKVD
jgi:hypothetical protein